MLFLWLKAFHIIAMVAWFAGLFYLPRLFIYHNEARDKVSIERFKVMEYRLFYAITYPAAIVTTILGIGLISMNWQYYSSAVWMWLKLFLVILLWGYHIHCGIYLKRFRDDKNKQSTRFFRIFNEIPTLFLILIVILVVTRPF
ncbi:MULTISPECIES: protoporphyrinogen oxidase HemJ [Legionella]|uniref:Protoporphyrinogen IX oxidase n=1 Tax=Legionella quinlivanii TaxID=45073 RepID=A0A364LL45_9GAMM|nr:MULTISPECIES: protoporphyrinogen oxidase HemJ [Legionella]MCE3046392.1 protoporphyrinogen oxidase HemJ [Legionella sp. 16cNR16C]RAP37135.1 TIGR00701 family protein [Legionella quinlivanii]